MNQKEVKTFLNKHINLDSDRYHKINKIYKETKEEFESKSIKLTKQGSIATKTAIRPKNPDHDYDVDIALFIQKI